MKTLFNKFRFGFFTVVIVEAIATSGSWAADSVSQFEQEMLSKPEIAQPEEPFVEIFLDAGCDGCSYGFQTGGVMTIDAWKRIFNHIGYLTAYSTFKPFETQQWQAAQRDIAPSAAQALGRHSGGVIMGLPGTTSEIDNVRSAYRTNLGLSMTHFFHDHETEFGTPGGNGLTRLKLSANGSYLKTINGSDFIPKLESANDSFKISFGLFIGQYIFGGSNYLLGHYTLDASNKLNSGWAVKVSNSTGFTGDNYIVFETASGNKVISMPFNSYIGRTWLDIDIEMQRASVAGSWDVSIGIKNVGVSSGSVQVPTLPDAGSGFVVGNIINQTRNIEIDDLSISTSSSVGSSIIAEYSFEPPVGFDATETMQVTQVADDSSRSNTLVANDSTGVGIYFSPVTGIEYQLGIKMKQHLVDDILSARQSFGKNSPILITNWLFSDVPGRASAWKSMGFTHGSLTYYYYGETQNQKTQLATVLHQRVPMELRSETDGDLWGHAWLGNVYNDKGVLSPEDFASLVVLGTLEGYRWFSTFVAMSNGHLALATADKTVQVHTNAETVYAMAKAASWFQSASDGLSNSVYFSPKTTLQDTDILIRARVNNNTNEMWFAGVLASSVFLEGKKIVDVTMPASTGTVINLATGESTVIESGVYQLSVSNTGVVQPYYFTTNASFKSNLPAPQVKIK